MCLSVFPACISVHSGHPWCLRKLEKDIGSPRTGVLDVCEPPCAYGYWDSNLGPPEEHPGCLSSEPFLQLPESLRDLCKAKK